MGRRVLLLLSSVGKTAAAARFWNGFWNGHFSFIEMGLHRRLHRDRSGSSSNLLFSIQCVLGGQSW